MATAYSFKQVQGSSSTGTYVTLYNTGASTTAIVSNILIANESSSAVTVRLGTDTTAGTPGAGEWILYDVIIAGNDTLSFGPLSLGNTQYLRASSSANTCTFSAAVAEIS
jgi:hypothetical protein